MTNRSKKSALKVQQGVAQPSSINSDALQQIRQNKTAALSTAQLIDGILAGNIPLLSKAITLIESTLPLHQMQAQVVLAACLPHAGTSMRVGITGVPGVGKSSFIEALGSHLTAKNHRVAVLAIDPSSLRTKGSILGDKTRMESLAADARAYIRPSPASGTLGGVAKKTWESIILCEAAGFDTIFVETVGVGQSETLVHSMVDFFLLLMMPGAGDELQGIKRGIMEMADAIVINKADGNNIARANAAKMDYQNALHLYPPSNSGWIPKVMLCSALENTGIEEVWNVVFDYLKCTTLNMYFVQNRNDQNLQLMHQALKDLLLTDFYQNEEIKANIQEIEQEIHQKKISAYNAAQSLSDLYHTLLKSTTNFVSNL